MNPALNYGKNMYRVEHITNAMGLLPVASLECLLQLWHEYSTFGPSFTRFVVLML